MFVLIFYCPKQIVLHTFHRIGNTWIMFTIQSQANIAEAVALSFEQIVAVRTFDHNGYVVIAVLTGPIFSYKEKQNLLQNIKTMVAENLDLSPEHVIVSYDMELFRAMDNVQDEDKAQLLEKATRVWRCILKNMLN